MKRRKSLHEIFQFFDGEGGAQGGGGAAAGAGGQGTGGDQGGGNHTAVFNAREHLGDDGSFKGDWWKAAGVSESVGKKFTRPEALARSYETLETQIGKKGVIVPGPNATQAERDAYYTALGRPANPDEYGFTKPEKIKLGDAERPVPDLAWDAKRAANWQQKLFEMGVPKEQAQKIMLAAVEESVTAFDGIEATKAQMQGEAKKVLQKEFGADYDTHMAAAARAAKQFGGDELVNHPGLGNDPVMIKALAKIGAAIGERPGAGTRQQGGRDAMSAAEAKVASEQLTKKIIELDRADRQWRNSAEAAQMKAEKTRLFQLANPER